MGPRQDACPLALAVVALAASVRRRVRVLHRLVSGRAYVIRGDGGSGGVSAWPCGRYAKRVRPTPRHTRIASSFRQSTRRSRRQVRGRRGAGAPFRWQRRRPRTPSTHPRVSSSSLNSNSDGSPPHGRRMCLLDEATAGGHAGAVCTAAPRKHRTDLSRQAQPSCQRDAGIVTRQ